MADLKRYFRRHWDEGPDGRVASWGGAVYYFETDEAGVVGRQVEAYGDGHVLVYDPEHVADEYGALTDQPIELAEFAAFEIGPETCEADLSRLEPFNR